MSEQWKKLRDLKAESDDVAEQRSSLADEAKDLRESVDGLIADGSKPKDWKELRRLWESLDSVEAQRRELGKELKELRRRMAALVKTGDDPEDDGQTSLTDRLAEKESVTLEAGGESVTLPAKGMDKALKRVAKAAARHKRHKDPPPKPNVP